MWDLIWIYLPWVSALITFTYSTVFWLWDLMALECSALNWVSCDEKQYVCACMSMWAWNLCQIMMRPLLSINQATEENWIEIHLKCDMVGSVFQLVVSLSCVCWLDQWKPMPHPMPLKPTSPCSHASWTDCWMDTTTVYGLVLEVRKWCTITACSRVHLASVQLIEMHKCYETARLLFNSWRLIWNENTSFNISFRGTNNLWEQFPQE